MASATATLSTTPRRIDEPAITQMRNFFAAPFGSRVASGLVADSDWPASLPLKVMSHPLETRSRDRPFRWKCRPQWVNRFETHSPLHPCWKKISHHHELRLPNG